MEIASLTKYLISSLFKGWLVAITTLIGTYIGHSIVLLFGFETPNTPTFLESAMSTLYFLTLTVIIAILIGELFYSLNQHFKERFISIFLYHFFFNHILRLGDGFFTNTITGIPYEFFSHIFPSLIFALLIAYLWKPKGELTSVFKKVNDYFKNRSTFSWVARFILGWLSFIPIYYFTSWLISPFIEPYYQELSDFVTTPLSIYIVIFVKICIGAIFVVVLMPIFILWQRSKTSLLFWVGFPVFVQSAVYASLIEFWLPTGMRFPYLIQYTVVSYLMAIIFVQLFFIPSESEMIDDQFKWMY